MSDNVPVPTVELLVKELKEVTDDWKLIGVSLGVPVKNLNTIKLNDPHGGVESWKIEMLHFWLRLKSDASWKVVVQALELNDYGVLAARVKRTYMLGKSAEVNEFETEVHADADVVEQLRDLEKSFGLMLSRFGSTLKDCDNELSEARTFLNRVCGWKFSNCGNISELLDKLCQEHLIDPFNLYQLKNLPGIFESKKEALDNVIEKYEKEKETFLENTTVSQFQRAIVEKVEPMLQKGKVRVTIKIPEEMNCDQTLKDIERLALKGFGKSQKYLVCMHATSGSVIISWVLPEDHLYELEKSVRKNAAVFRKSGVEEVTIGGKIVFSLEEDPSQTLIMASAEDGQMKAFRDFMEETEKTVDSVSSLVSKVSEAADKLCAGVEATSEALIKQNKKVRAAYQDLKSAVECSLKFVKKVEALIRAGGSLDSGTDSMITSLSQTGRRFWILWEIPNPNYEDLIEFIEKIKRGLSDVEDAFLLFKESITTAINSTDKAALECKHCVMKAEEQRDKTKVTGTIVSGLGAIAGAAVGALAGPVGAVVGAAVVGGIGGSTTIGMARHYENQSKAFNNQLAILNDWLESANLLNNTVTDVHLATVSLGTAVDQIQYSWWQRKQTIDTLCHDLITLNTFLSEIHEGAKDCSKLVQTASKKIDLVLGKHL